MLMCLNNNTCLARYEYDSFGICTVLDGDGKINTDANFIGNINPFRWKSFYFDTESNLYYIKGNYYDPETGLYVNATSIENAINSAYIPRSLDRNGLLCNNTIELSSTNTQENLYTELIPVHTQKMLKALPSIPQWVGIASNVIDAGLSLSVAFRTSYYAFKYSEIIDLMRLDGIVQLPGKYTNFINGLAYGFVALDTVLDIYSNIQQNKSVEYIIGSAAYTLSTELGILWLSGKISATVGAAVTGPVGFAVGGIIGVIVGGILTLLINLLKGVIFQ